MNYFELIQAISKIKLGREPSLFSEITAKKYDKIIDAINDSLDDFFLHQFHGFRKKILTFNTASSQQAYAHIYGSILRKGLKITDSNSYKSTLVYKPDFDDFVTDAASIDGLPLNYTVFNDRILLDPVPDDTYTITVYHNTDKWVKNMGTIDQSSASGQTNLYLAATAGFVADDVITIEPNTPREETKTISSVTTDDYVTLTANLTYTHTSGFAEKYKRILEYETDEPNFPSQHHLVLEYDILKRLYYGDTAKLLKYQILYDKKYRDIMVEGRGSEDSVPYFSIQ